MKNLRWRVLLVLIILVAAIWTLWPTVQYYTLSPEARTRMPRSKLAELRKKAVNLGLDLQGGMYLLLEVDTSKLKPEEIEGAVDRAIEIIRNRIDQWGVFEPSIQKLGTRRILVQLPGVLDRERARSLIGRTAQLEFRLLADGKTLQEVLEKIDRVLAQKTRPDTAATDTTLAEEEHPFTSLLASYRGDIAVSEDNLDSLQKLLSLEEVQAQLPPGYEFLFGKTEEVQGRRFRRLYLVKKTPEMTGAYLADARESIAPPGDPEYANQPIVVFQLNRQGAARFAQITGANVGKRLAIVLDNQVQMAPTIQERISGGSARITGFDSLEEAKEIAVVLRAGALPAPVRIIEERSVGPLLGKDSIQKGIRALIVGMILVLLFMVVYYRVAGLIADLALLLNLVFVLALLAGFGATLTLPGMAGLILTVGMAVDANVLIFERIREELRSGQRRNLKAIIDAGYSRAMITILDANVTTLVAALVLLRFGTGPIRGFAITLSLGIVVSFFTAIFVTKIIFDYLVVVRRAETVSI